MLIAYCAIITVLLIIIIMLIRKHLWNRKHRRIIYDKLSDIEKAITEFDFMLSGRDYINRRVLFNWITIHSNLGVNVAPKYHKIGLNQNVVKTLEKFFSYSKNYKNYVNEHNDDFAEDCLSKNSLFFDTFESYPLDKYQRLAIVHEEDANLVIAGAGCGKTTTLVGKLAYLTNIKNVPKEEILMLAFTRKAANEMKDRIKERLGEDFEISTFHSFGYKVVGFVEDNKPSLAFNGNESGKNQYIKALFDKEMENEIFAKLVVEFFFYEFTTQLKSKKEDSQLVDYLGNVMKSKQEVKIANFLFLHGINYIYERDYEYKTSSKDYRQYIPDYYLPDNKIYIEHFGIKKDGKASDTFDNPKKYEEDIKWKRELHKKNKTELIETYSYEDSDGELILKLRAKLERAGVKFDELNYKTAFTEKIRRKDRILLIEIINTFLSLFKSNQYTIDQLITKANSHENKILYLAFIKIFEPIMMGYEKYLKENKVIDFDDMIAKATNYLVEGKYLTTFKYVLVDEFQDISVGRYKLINALNKQHFDMQLFCVGDDWQSIFRFAGSDISLFLNFEEYFGTFHETKIENTYRFPQEIADLSNSFILQNHSQKGKLLKTTKWLNSKPFEIFYKINGDDSTTLDRILGLIEKECNKKECSVLIVGRYNWDEPENLNSIKNRYKKIGISIDFMTIHKAKGLEADYVIIDNVIDETTGFPSQIADHEVLNLVLQNPEEFPFAEERRLFYVAMTRTKNKLYIIGQKRKVSTFVFDICTILNRNSDIDLANSKICPDCFGNLELRKGRFGDFLGCSNYDSCTYTMSVSKLKHENDMKKFHVKFQDSKDDDLPF